jgi:hypothetical protein
MIKLNAEVMISNIIQALILAGILGTIAVLLEIKDLISDLDVKSSVNETNIIHESKRNDHQDVEIGNLREGLINTSEEVKNIKRILK